MSAKRIILIVVAGVAALFLLIQFVPYGRAQVDPPVVQEPKWDSPQTRELAQRACFDCHSNETARPWYAAVAPASWLVTRDVTHGREHLNFSDWNQSHAEHGHAGHEPEDMREVILSGEMPPASYLLMHPAARLTDAEKEALAAGLLATAAQTGGAQSDDHDSDHADDEHTDDHADDERTDDHGREPADGSSGDY